jgi:FtsP/CotA-like multicopper oxidase with cupredoxin domain
MLYNRGYGSVEFRSVEELFTIEFTGEPPLENVSLPEVTRTIEPPGTEGAEIVDFVFTLPPVDELGHSEFRINGVPHWKAEAYRADLGQTQIWVLKNDTKWDHPFHLHGFFFLVLDENNVPKRPLVWKDTINVPLESTERVLVTFDERPGTWMFHCHILDHADGGLMGTVHVGPGEPAHATHQGGPNGMHSHPQTH